MSIGWERTDIAGLPAFVGETPGPAQLSLVFRAGQADETLRQRGLNHLIEHLALGDFAPLELVSGGVDLWSTYATVEGDDDELVPRMEEVARRFAEPPVERLEAERRIVSVEDEGSLPHMGSVLLRWLFGSQGPGLPVWDELGVVDCTPDELRAHAAQRFTAGNAALVCTRPVAGLGTIVLPLPAGRKRPIPDFQPLPIDLPCEVGADERMVVGGIVDSPANGVLGALLFRRAHRIVRRERGLAYTVRAGSQPLGPSRRVHYVVADATGDDAVEAARLVIEDIRALAAGDLGADELAQAKADLGRTARYVPGTYLRKIAVRELGWGPQPRDRDFVAANEAVTADEVVEAAGQLRDGMLAILPQGTTTGLLPEFSMTGDGRVEGDWYPAAGGAVDGVRGLIVGKDGVTAEAGDDATVTVLFFAVEAAVREPGGSLVVIGHDGLIVRVDEHAFTNGRSALVAVESALRPNVFVPAPGSTREEDAAERRRRREEAEAQPAPDSPAYPGRVPALAPRDASSSTPTPVVWTRNR